MAPGFPIALFMPEPGVTYSKSQVNKAGDSIRAYYAYRRRPNQSADEVQELQDRAIEALTVITWWRAAHVKPLAKAGVNLRYHVGKYVDGKPQVSQRLKRVPTILDKLERYPGMELARMADIGGVRARIPDLTTLREISKSLKKSWEIRKTQDYIARPKPDGYRALHLIVVKDGRLVEVQLRTERQDIWANNVEKDGRLGDSGYKFGRGSAVVRDYYRIVSDAYALLDAGEDLDPRIRKEIADGYNRVQAQSEQAPIPPREELGG